MLCTTESDDIFIVDHCLEYWREAAMCRGDTTLATMFLARCVAHVMRVQQARVRELGRFGFVGTDENGGYGRSRSVGEFFPTLFPSTIRKRGGGDMRVTKGYQEGNFLGLTRS